MDRWRVGVEVEREVGGRLGIERARTCEESGNETSVRIGKFCPRLGPGWGEPGSFGLTPLGTVPLASPRSIPNGKLPKIELPRTVFETAVGSPPTATPPKEIPTADEPL